jgi:EF hand
MKTSKLIVLMGSTCLLLAGAAAQAQGPGGHHRGGDRHGGPGAGGPERAMMMLRAADANGDNTITRAEVDGLQAEMFAWMDRNSDGYLDEADQSPVRQRLRARMQDDAAAAGDEGEGRRWGRRGRGRGGEGPEGGPEGGMPGRQFDADEDGRISRAEFLGGENRLFAMLDADEDGEITPAELDAAAERRQDRRHWWRN